ncbi:MAG: ATP-binding protein, partial [Gemmatimonadales bacterium]
GPPGAGKTMLARRLPSILPSLTLSEALDVTRIHSVAGLLPPGQALVTRRPFRAPHHTVSYAGLIGGGAIPRPGEVSLAHHGVLFLDEVAELPPNVLEVLRQPLEDGHVTISRAAMTLGYPARFLFVAAMNPCPCGHAGDPSRACLCPPLTVQKYLSRISGPLLDRVDIHLNVPPVAYNDLTTRKPAESSATVRARVEAARARQLERFRGMPGLYANAHMGPRELGKLVRIDAATEAVLKGAIERLGLSARAYHRVLKLARTLADLQEVDEIGPAQVAEAIQYRVLDRGDG